MSAVVLVSTDGLSHEEWLNYRRLGIGGSDASVVCGVNKYKSPVELWMEKTGQMPPEEAGEAAYWGTQLEPLVRAEFTRRTGIDVIVVNQIIQSQAHPFMLANLDGVCRCPTHGKCIFEAKTANAFKADQWEDDAVPYEYILQTQHYLAVSGYAGVYIAVLIGGNNFAWKFIKRDEELISMLIRTERDFWTHVQDDVPPPPDGSEACAKFLSQRYKNCVPKSKIVLPDSAASLIRHYNTVREQLDQLTAQKREAENKLKELLGENEIGTVGDNYIAWRTVTQERFDSKSFESEQPDLHKKYMRKSSHRRFSVKMAS